MHDVSYVIGWKLDVYIIGTWVKTSVCFRHQIYRSKLSICQLLYPVSVLGTRGAGRGRFVTIPSLGWAGHLRAGWGPSATGGWPHSTPDTGRREALETLWNQGRSPYVTLRTPATKSLHRGRVILISPGGAPPVSYRIEINKLYCCNLAARRWRS